MCGLYPTKLAAYFTKALGSAIRRTKEEMRVHDPSVAWFGHPVGLRALFLMRFRTQSTTKIAHFP